jgi:hypothetical protein
MRACSTGRAAAGRLLSAMSSCSGSGAAFSAVLVPLGRELVALTLPRARKRGESCSRLVEIRCLLIVEDLVHVIGHDGREHVQHLMPFIAGSKEPRRGLPNLRRIVGPELVSDDLVHRQVKSRVDRRTIHVDLGQAGCDCPMQFGVLSEDQHPPVVFVVRIQEREVDAVKLPGCTGHCERASIVAGHARTLPGRGLRHVTDCSADNPRATCVAAWCSGTLWPEPGPLLISGDRVAVELRARSGGKVSLVADFFTPRDGKIARLAIYSGLPIPPSSDPTPDTWQSHESARISRSGLDSLMPLRRARIG